MLLVWAGEGWAQRQRVDSAAPSKAGVEGERGRSNPPAACRDTAPHKTRFIRVDAGVWLEVLDWGGEHQPHTMVLLTGLGDSAHVYDQFAAQFTATALPAATPRRPCGCTERRTTSTSTTKPKSCLRCASSSRWRAAATEAAAVQNG